MWCAAATTQRPSWVRVDRLLGEHGPGVDSARARQEFQRQMEQRRLEEADEAVLKTMRRGWYIGGEEFRQRLLKQMEAKMGNHHSRALRRESAEAQGQRIIGEELKRLGWRKNELSRRRRRESRLRPFFLSPSSTLGSL